MKNYLLFIMIYLTGADSSACIHFPAENRFAIVEGLQEFLLFHDGKNAHMVLKTELSAEKFPQEIAWVLPFPSLPSQYKEVDGPLFMELAQFFPNDGALYKGRDGGFGASLGIAKSAGIKVHEKVVTGDYEVQPIEILNESKGDELNQWLAKNKFNPMPKEKQKRYIKKGAAFLAIRMKMNKPGQSAIVSRPLHVVYPSETLSVPMLFTHDGRTFDMDIYLYSHKELKTDLTKLYFNAAKSAPYKRERLKPMVENLIGDHSGFITKYSAKGLNSADKDLRKLSEDPSFSKGVLLN